MPGVTPLLHTTVRGESSPFSTVYISPTNGVTDASVTLGPNPYFELDVAFYAGSQALLKVVRLDGTSDQKLIVHIMQPAIRAYYNLEELWGTHPVELPLPRPSTHKGHARKDEDAAPQGAQA